MYSRRIFREITIFVTGIVLLATASVLLIVLRYAIILGVLGLWVAVWLIHRLVYRLNTTNRRIRLFFDAIDDDESTLVFPEINLSPEQIQLNRTFNRINRMLAESKRRSGEQEQFYKALVEQIPDGIVSWDDSGRIRLANRTALRLLECTALTDLSQLEAIVPGLPTLIREAEEKGNALLKLNGDWHPRQLLLTIDRITAGPETLTILALQDIDDRLDNKEAEAWGRLTHVLTHEIMNSIAPIVSLSRTLTSYFSEAGSPRPAKTITDAIVKKTLRGLEVVESQGARLIRFTDSYRQLSFSRMPAVRPYSLTEQFRELEELLQPDLAAAGIAYEREADPAEIRLRGDPALLFQVFHNLLKNAIQALAQTDRPVIRVRIRRTDRLTIDVCDNGPGIPAEIREDIFIPFFTTKENGSGIGLSLSRQIVRRHGGRLFVRSEPGAGCCFHIDLPL